MKHETATCILCTAFSAVCLVAACSSCHSSRAANQPPGNTELVIANQRAASRVEATIDYLESTAKASHERIGAITETSATIADAVDRLEYLFGQYESEVTRLLTEIDALRDQLEEARATDSGGGDRASSGGVGEGGDPGS